MPWIKVDDHYDEHPKFAAAGPLGMAMWLAGMAYCNRNLTDGFIPWTVARTLLSWDFLDGAGTVRIYVGSDKYVDEESVVTCPYVIELLISAGLWTEEQAGYRVHDYAVYQPTRAQIEAERAAKVAAGQAGGIATARARAKAGAKARPKAKSKPVPVPQRLKDAEGYGGENLIETRLSDEEQRANLDRLAAMMADAGVLIPSKVNGEERRQPTTDTEVIEHCRSVLADESAPEWKREAAKAQLQAMRVEP